MARSGWARVTEDTERSEPTAADLLDPVALEARLADARARRAEVLARRGLADRDPRGEPKQRQGWRREPAAPPAPPPRLTVPLPQQQAVPVRQNGRRRLRGIPALAVTLFLTGLLGGAVATVLVAPDLRQRLAGNPGETATTRSEPEASDDALVAAPERPVAAANLETARAPEPAPAPPPLAAAEPETAPALPQPADRASAAPVGDALSAPVPDAGPPEIMLAALPEGLAVPAGTPPPTLLANSPDLAAPAPPAEAPTAPEPEAATSEPAKAAIAAPAGESAPTGAMRELAALPTGTEPPTVLANAPDLAAPARPAAAPVVPEPEARTPELATATVAAPAGEDAPPEVMLELAALPESTAPSVPDRAEPTNPLAATRVLLNYPPSAASDAGAAADALLGAGAQDASTGAARVSVSRTNVRYFHADDRAAAEEVAAIIGRTSGGTAPEARDFTDFSPRPPAGTLEVWLAGEAPAPVAARTEPARSAPPPSATPRPTVADQARTRMQREVESLLRQRLQGMRSN